MNHNIRDNHTHKLTQNGKYLSMWIVLLILFWESTHPELIAQQKTLITALQETIITVSDLGAVTKFFMNVGEWETVWLGDATKQEKQYWGIPEQLRVEMVVLKNPQEKNGYIRLVKLHGNEQIQLRSSFQIWNPGLIFALHLKVSDLQKTYYTLQKLGWHGLSEALIENRDKSSQPEVFMKGFDGIVLHLSKRPAAAIHKIREPKNFSPITGIFIATRSLDSAVTFFTQRLGFKISNANDSIVKTFENELFGAPQTPEKTIRLRYETVTPSVISEGFITVLQTTGITPSKIYSASNPLLNLGSAVVRFFCTDLNTYYKRIVQAGVRVKQEPKDYFMEPFGKIRGMLVEIPDGVLCEFFELQKN